MTPFEQYLIDIGYKRYRHEYIKRKFVYIESNTGYSFSTMVSGGLDYRYIKDGHEIIFGLSEKDKPPTLTYPRPFNINSDDKMNRILKEKTPEEVYQSLITR